MIEPQNGLAGKTAFVVTGHLGTVGGGAKAPLLLARELQELGIEVTVFAGKLIFGDTSTPPGLNVVTPKVKKGFRWALPLRSLAIQARRRIQTQTPDYVFVCGITFLARLMLDSEAAGSIWIWEFSNATPGNRHVDWGAVELLNRANGLLSPSGAIDDCIRNNYEYTGRIERLPFWIEEPDGAGLPTPGIKAFDFIYLGRRDPEKGLSELVAAVSLLVPERPGLKVLIAGPGKAHEYQAQAEDLGVSSHIEFRFLATEAETRTALAQSRFLVLPSYHEGFPLVLLEAGQLGIPFIATDVGSIPEMVGRSNAGFLIRPGDAAGLGKAMSAALNETAPVYAERKKAAEEMFHKLSSPIRVRRTLLSVLRQCADAST